MLPLTTTLFASALLVVGSVADRDYNLPPASSHQPTGEAGVVVGVEEGEKGVPDDPLGIWEEYGEDDPTNSCFLISWEDGVRAAYLCRDGTLWQVNIESEGDRCVYNRTVTNSFGEATNNEATINCIAAREWIQGLVQTDVIAGIPDTHFFSNATTPLPALPPAINPTNTDSDTDTDEQLPTDNGEQGCT